MCIPSIRLTLSFSDVSQVEQTKCSLFLRTGAVGMGAIALLIGVLILCNIPGLSTLGTTGGGLFSGVGALMFLTGIFLRCIKESDQPGSEYSTQIPYMGSQGDSQRASSDVIIDFAKITPKNYEQYLDVSQEFDWGKQGNFIFTKEVHDEDFSSSYGPYKYKKGDACLIGRIAHVDGGCYGNGGLEICNGEFVHYPQMSAPSEHFSNLKDFFDYMFRGNFYQGECTRDMEFFALKTIDGKEVRYYNPYKK